MTLRVVGTPMQRFLARVNVGPWDACWPWDGAVSEEGYGRFSIDKSTRVRAHRYLYERVRGPIPEGLVIDHLCRNTRCVNPAHLEVVTHRENILRGRGMGARHARRTHCAHGHAFTLENTIQTGPEGRWRRCRACMYGSRQELAA